MKWFLVPLAAWALPLAAQPANPTTPAAPSRPAGTQRVFVLKYADPVALADVLRVFGVSVVANSEIHAVAVASSFPDVLASVDDAITRLDVPASAPQNIEISGYYVIGGATASPLGSALPKDLDSLATELSKESALKSYRLLDTLTVRMRAGQGGAASGTAGTVGNGSPMIETALRIRAATISSDAAAVRVDRLDADVKLPVAAGGGQFSTSDLAFSADVDLKPGERVLVGRTGMNRDQSLFLVLTARIAK